MARTIPTTAAIMTTTPMMRLSTQMPRKLNRERTLLTKYVMLNHQPNAPV